MIWLSFTIQRIEKVLELASSLLTADYPYPQAPGAIREIHNQLQDRLDVIQRLDPNRQTLVKAACLEALHKIHVFFPVLGFLYRSKNLANPFEAILPLQRLAQKLMGTDSELVLSSEWDYSPFTYLQIPQLPRLVLIGFPASEASNALLLPLAGHELGHSVWLDQGLHDKYDVVTTVKTVEVILGQLSEAEKYLGPIDPDALPNETERLEVPQTWALWQCQEIYCDFVGLRIFGKAYLQAFGYLISPALPGYRSPRYPTTTQRVSYLLRGANRFGVDVPRDYESQFFDSGPVRDKEMSFFATVSDEVADAFVDDLLGDAERVVAAKGIRLPTDGEIVDVERSFRGVVPADNPPGVSAILNAAWRLAEDPNPWTEYPGLNERKSSVLNELTLKTLEVFDIAERLPRDRQAKVPPAGEPPK